MQLTTEPLQFKQRTIIVDVLRGWALLGVVLMNYIDFSGLALSTAKLPTPTPADNIVNTFLGIFFSAKSWTMLSLLFGYGFTALIQNIKSKGVNANWFFIRRMFWLFVLAFVNCCFFFGDILKDYALLGLVMLLFSRLSGKTAFYIAAVLIFMIPIIQAAVKMFMPYPYAAITDSLMPLYHSTHFWDVVIFNLKGTYLLEVLSRNYAISVHLVMLACMLTGMAAFKLRVFDNLSLKIRQLKKTFWISLAAAFVFIMLFGITKKFNFGFIKYYNPWYLLVLSSMIFILTAICWLYAAGKCKAFFNGLQAIGKMTLTNYMVQNVISFFVFSNAGFGVFTSWHAGYYVLLAVAIYTLQIFFSIWWLQNFSYGPIEWVWRQLSYGKYLPLKKGKPVEVANAGI